MRLSDIFLYLVGKSTELDLANSIPCQSGHNGPYNDPETPVRNSCHWLITNAKCYELTGEDIYINKVRELADYLLTKEARPFDYSFHHRKNPNKDKCNGVIGQAWTFEALAQASETLGDPKYASLAEKVFFQHQFNEEYGLWNRLEIDGETLSIDQTFNHQLWFAACASLLKTSHEKEIKRMVKRFLDCLPENITVLDNGLIYHPIERNLDEPLNKASASKKVKKMLDKILMTMKLTKPSIANKFSDEELRNRMVNKSIGYQAFNLYAFALLKSKIPKHHFWNSDRFKSAVDYLLSEEYIKGLDTNMYAYPYNPPGFEVPFALWALKDLPEKEFMEKASWWISEQFRRCYNAQTGMMDRNTEDPVTHTARIYELTRLPDVILKKITLGEELI